MHFVAIAKRLQETSLSPDLGRDRGALINIGRGCSKVVGTIIPRFAEDRTDDS